MNKETIQSFYEEYGELILRLSNGDKFEIHPHDVVLEDDYLLNDKDEEGTAVFYNQIVSVDWHESGYE